MPNRDALARDFGKESWDFCDMESDASPERTRSHREFFAKLITATAGVSPDSGFGLELKEAFAITPREKFVGPPPWKVFTRTGFVETHSSDPAFLYQDVVVPLGVEGSLNNGQPTLHAFCITTLAPKKGERVVHVGAGSGYYTAVLARLVGQTGVVEAYEIHPELARRATDNLAEFPQVTVHARSGSEAPLPDCDILYVNAGASEPLAVWLDALHPDGRLLFPLTPGAGVGAMLLVTKREDGSFAARFLFQAQFVPCVGAQDETMIKRLAEALANGGWSRVKSLRRDNTPDETCWYSGRGWWLSYV
jgi:protein-L-isoaspartate(D-aspartate) O-methyltransferase